MTESKSQLAARFTVKVVPGSRRTVYCGLHDGMYKIRLAAAPEKGKANKALIDFLAGLLAVKKNAVMLESGQTSPLKQICVMGVDNRYAAERFAQTLSE